MTDDERKELLADWDTLDVFLMLKSTSDVECLALLELVLAVLLGLVAGPLVVHALLDGRECAGNAGKTAPLDRKSVV